jgi:hypothetical protein
MNMFKGLSESFKQRAASLIDNIPESVKERTASFKDNLSQRVESVVGTAKAAAKEFSDVYKYGTEGIVTTEVLTEENFKEQLRKMKDDFIIKLKTVYKVENPDIDCLLKKEYVKVYTNKICLQYSPTKCNSIDDTRPFNVFAKPKQFGNFNTFDELLDDPIVTLENFVIQHNLGRLGGIKFSMKIDKDALGNKKIQMVCQPPAVTSPAVTSSGGHRRMRRSSRKNYKKVRTAKRARSSKSRNTRRQRK